MSNLPEGDSAVVTALGVGGWPGPGLRLDELGWGLPFSQIVMKLALEVG